jgi:hypothetical protein
MGKILSKIKNWYNGFFKSKASYERRVKKPVHDWGMILSITAFTLFLIAGLSFYFFTQLNQGKLFKTVKRSAEDKGLNIDAGLLKKTVTGIKEREARFNQVKQGTTTPSDPSV